MSMDASLPLPDPARIRWQCRRGMLELDILLLPFFDNAYEILPLEQQRDFMALLAFPDQTLYSWLIGQAQPETIALQTLIQLIREKHSMQAT